MLFLLPGIYIGMLHGRSDWHREWWPAPLPKRYASAMPESATEASRNLLNHTDIAVQGFYRGLWWSISQKIGLEGLRVELTLGLEEPHKGLCLSSRHCPSHGTTSPVLCFYQNFPVAWNAFHLLTSILIVWGGWGSLLL